MDDQVGVKRKEDHTRNCDIVIVIGSAYTHLAEEVSLTAGPPGATYERGASQIGLTFLPSIDLGEYDMVQLQG